MKYRKKPLVVEARQWDGTEEAATEIITWIQAHDQHAEYVVCVPARRSRTGVLLEPMQPSHIAIRTPEGTMRAERGDWVIRGVLGEIYPCKSAVFDATYEPVEPTEADKDTR